MTKVLAFVATDLPVESMSGSSLVALTWKNLIVVIEEDKKGGYQVARNAKGRNTFPQSELIFIARLTEEEASLSIQELCQKYWSQIIDALFLKYYETRRAIKIVYENR